MHNDDIGAAFRFFTEVGIIAQLSARMIEKHLPERLNETHFGLLSHLLRRPEGDTPQQLAFAFQVPKTSMTHMIKVMEAEELIAVVPNPDDARSKIARITPGGAALIERAVAAMAQEMAQMQPGFEFDAAKACLEPLAKVRVQLDAARNVGKPKA